MGASLHGKIAVVTGATRGAGRGIAAGLGEAGATVVCTGRSSTRGNAASDYDRPETIEQTATIVTDLLRRSGTDRSGITIWRQDCGSCDWAWKPT